MKLTSFETDLLQSLESLVAHCVELTKEVDPDVDLADLPWLLRAQGLLTRARRGIGKDPVLTGSVVLDNEDFTALRRFKLNHGKTWKKWLAACWSSGNYPTYTLNNGDAATLQHIRNIIGHSGLEKLRLPK